MLEGFSVYQKSGMRTTQGVRRSSAMAERRRGAQSASATHLPQAANPRGDAILKSPSTFKGRRAFSVSVRSGMRTPQGFVESLCGGAERTARSAGGASPEWKEPIPVVTPAGTVEFAGQHGIEWIQSTQSSRARRADRRARLEALSGLGPRSQSSEAGPSHRDERQ